MMLIDACTRCQAATRHAYYSKKSDIPYTTDRNKLPSLKAALKNNFAEASHHYAFSRDSAFNRLFRLTQRHEAETELIIMKITIMFILTCLIFLATSTMVVYNVRKLKETVLPFEISIPAFDDLPRDKQPIHHSVNIFLKYRALTVQMFAHSVFILWLTLVMKH
jgi:hypothetical protein